MLGNHLHQTGEVQFCSVLIFPAIGIHVLTQQGDFPHIVGGKLVQLRQNLCWIAGNLPSPHVGNDAVGAVVVAAVHDGYKGGKGTRLQGHGSKGVDRILVNHQGRLVLLHRLDNLLEMLLLEGSHHIVDDRIILFQAVQKPLGHAAGHHQSQVLPPLVVSLCCGRKMPPLSFLGTGADSLESRKPAQPPEDAVFRRGPHGTGIYDSQIGSLRCFCSSPATAHHQLLNGSRLSLVHLASVGLKKIGHRKSIPKKELWCKLPSPSSCVGTSSQAAVSWGRRTVGFSSCIQAAAQQPSALHTHHSWDRHQNLQ